MGELLQLPAGEMAQLPVMQLLNRRVEPGEKGQPGGSDPDQNAPAVLFFATAAQDAALLQAVEKTGDVRFTGNHAGGDLPAKQAIRSAAQDAEDIVRDRGQVVFAEKLGGRSRQVIGGSHEFDEEGFFEAGRNCERRWTGPWHLPIRYLLQQK